MSNLLIQTVNSDVTFWEKGNALRTLLYDHKLGEPNQEAYCRKTFNISAERARQLIEAADVYYRLLDNPTTARLLPANEAQIRPLCSVPKERQLEVWAYIIQNAPGGKITQKYVQDVCTQVNMLPNKPIQYLTAADVPNTIWQSDNDLDIPLLSLRLQAEYCDLPFSLWGAVSRNAVAATWHFYTDDIRFDGLIDDPTPIINSHCINAVEPNFSIYGQMARIEALCNIYQKRRIARFWQSYGVRVFVDMNVHPEFYQDNLLGVPEGWKAYATRGYTDRLDDTIQEYNLACERAQTTEILFVVYGGGVLVKETAKKYGWLWFPEHADIVRGRVSADVEG